MVKKKSQDELDQLPQEPQPHPPAKTNRLISYLASTAEERSDKPVALAKALGIGYVYLSLLYRGERPPENLSRKVLVAAAKYLKVPVAQAYLWAGALQPSDFIYEGESTPKGARLGEDVHAVMSRHPQWGGFMPSERQWAATPQETRLALTLLFERATGIELVDKTSLNTISICDPKAPEAPPA